MSSPDRKRTPEESTAAAVVVTPHKKKQRLELEEEDNDDNRITAESVMGFPKYPKLTNREIVLLIGLRGKRRRELHLGDY